MTITIESWADRMDGPDSLRVRMGKREAIILLRGVEVKGKVRNTAQSYIKITFKLRAQDVRDIREQLKHS